MPVPAEALLGKSEAQLKQIYKAEYAKPPAARRVFAKQLVDEARNPNSDAATRFVLFREGANLAASSGDITTAISAIDDLSKVFTVDAPQFKANAIVRSAKMIDSMPQAMVFLTTANSLLEQFSAAGDPAAAMKVANTMSYVAAETRNRPIVEGVRGRVLQMKELQAEFDRLKLAMDHPPASDRNADLAAGKFACFFKDDWQAGLGRLMNCPDAKIRDVAARDVSNPKAPTERFGLGNSWWDLAQKQTGFAKTKFQVRAGYWYRQALPALGVLDRGLAEKRIVASLGAPAEATTFGAHAYIYDATVMTWHEAKFACELAGGHLACVESEKEHLFLKDLLAGRRSWLGGSDEKEEGKWTWVNGSAFEFAAWRAGEPNNANGNENYLIVDNAGHWFDVPVTPYKGTGFVCEWE